MALPASMYKTSMLKKAAPANRLVNVEKKPYILSIDQFKTNP